MDHRLVVPGRPIGTTVGLGVLRGVGCGAALGALAGAGLAVWDGLRPATPGLDDTPFSVFLTGYAAVIGALVGAVVGLVAAAAAMAVLAGAQGSRRGRSWVVSVVAAAVATTVVLVVLNLFAENADGRLLFLGQAAAVGLVSAAVALWQVRRLVRPPQ